MGFLNLKQFLLVLLPIITSARAEYDLLAPTFYDHNISCNEVECGKGSCEADGSDLFNFKCNCQPGWKRTRLREDDEEKLQFLPCTIPNCSLDYSCMPAAPPPPAIPINISLFDPCYWVYCGEGTCRKNATYTHTCQCNSGYSNLLNISAFPCYSDCAIKSDDCGRLGIKVANSTSNPESGGVSVSMAKLSWMAIVVMSTAMVFWK